MLFRSSPVHPIDGEELWRIPWPVEVDTTGVPAWSDATPSQKKRPGKREMPRNRCHEPARGQDTNDDDDESENFFIFQLSRVHQ